MLVLVPDVPVVAASVVVVVPRGAPAVAHAGSDVLVAVAVFDAIVDVVVLTAGVVAQQSKERYRYGRVVKNDERVSN